MENLIVEQRPKPEIYLMLNRQNSQYKKKIKPRKNHKLENYPFVKIFEMHKKGYPVIRISRKVKISHSIISSIIHGGIVIPKSEIKEIEKLGFTICQCCKQRIVPIEPVDYVTLTRLCSMCYKGKTNNVESWHAISPDIKHP